MKKILLLSIVMLLVALVLTGCKPAEPADVDPTDTPEPTASPTIAAVTPKPTVTPRPLGTDVIWPEADATMIAIDPITKPTPVPIEFKPYETYTFDRYGISFEVPSYYEELVEESAVSFQEPFDQIRSGFPVPATITIEVYEASNAQTTKDAENFLAAALTAYRQSHPTLQTTDQGDNSVGDMRGRYVTYWEDVTPDEESAEPVKMRGRWLVLPSDKRLYTIRYICPADRNGDYLNTFYQVRSTFKEL